jgi:hypothetical protein
MARINSIQYSPFIKERGINSIRRNTGMKKLIIIVLVTIGFLCMGCGNYKIGLGVGSELNYNFAIIYAPDGGIVHSGALDSWKNYEDATVNLWFEDGYKFLAHSLNVVMSNKPINY